MTQAQLGRALEAYRQRKVDELAANKQAGQAFLDANAKQPDVTTTESGLQIKVVREGEGSTPTPGDIVTVQYEGRLIDGTVFDSSYAREEPLVVTWNPERPNVIQGWMEGLSLMKEGGAYELYVPSQLGYRDNANGEIPAGSTLIFKMEIVDIQPADAQFP